MTIEETADSGFDIESAMHSIAEKMELSADEKPEHQEDEPAERQDDTPEPVAAAPVTRAPPKSWATEKHELWGKLPADAQDYYEQREKQFLDGIEQYKGGADLARKFSEVVTPYKPMLAAMGVSETDAVRYLLNAQYKLTNGTDQERLAAYQKMGSDFGFIDQEDEPQIDPIVKNLQLQVKQLQSVHETQRQEELHSLRSRANSEVEAFSADPKNVHFSEVTQDMVQFINAGLPIKDAYDRAVWANPVTRAKEQARFQTEAQAQLKERAKAESESARTASSVNIRGQQSHREPTEPKGSMEDTMKATLEKIKRRVN